LPCPTESICISHQSPPILGLCKAAAQNREVDKDRAVALGDGFLHRPQDSFIGSRKAKRREVLFLVPTVSRNDKTRAYVYDYAILVGAFAVFNEFNSNVRRSIEQ